jgi:hypothetical protein
MPLPAITRVSGLAVTPTSSNKNNGFYAPQLTTAQRDAIPTATLVNGAIIYNTNLNTFQSYQVINGASIWLSLSAASTSTATGVALTTGTPFTLPSGPRAGVEVAANQVNGFMYYDATNNVVRARQNGAWATVTIA